MILLLFILSKPFLKQVRAITDHVSTSAIVDARTALKLRRDVSLCFMYNFSTFEVLYGARRTAIQPILIVQASADTAVIGIV